MARPKPGDVRWVYYDRGGGEHDFETEPDDQPTLRVEVIAVGGDLVEEETMTRNRKVRLGGYGGADWIAALPDGAREAGWVIAGEFVDGDAWTRWTRRRELN